MPGGKTAREVQEHLKIQEITGGVPARFSNRVVNKKDPISRADSIYCKISDMKESA